MATPLPPASLKTLKRMEQSRTPDVTENPAHNPAFEGEPEKMAWEGCSAVEHANYRMQRIEFERRKAKLQQEDQPKKQAEGGGGSNA